MRINDKNGEIILHCGTMFGGKSSALLSDVRKCRIANLNVLLLKPIIDKRYSVDKVVNHDGVSNSAILVEKLSEIDKMIDGNNTYDVIAIDEFQFIELDIDLKDFIVERILKQNKKLIVSGLELDSDLNPFENMSKIFPYSTSIYKHKPICKQCHEPAYTIYCTVEKNGQVLVGSDDIYEPLCASCYLERSSK